MYRKDLYKTEYYTRKAHREGYPARSVYKLKEMDENLRIFRKGDIVLDLGASPGSWLAYISERIGSKGRVLGIDIEDVKIQIKPNMGFLKKDVRDVSEEELKEWKAKCDVVVADMAPKTTGIAWKDVGLSLELSETAFDIAKLVLKDKGVFVCKIFEGEGTDDFVREVQKAFKTVKRARPQAVIKRSKEFYIVAKK